MEFGKIYIPLFNFLISNALHCILLPQLKWFQDRRNWLWERGGLFRLIKPITICTKGAHFLVVLTMIFEVPSALDSTCKSIKKYFFASLLFYEACKFNFRAIQYTYIEFCKNVQGNFQGISFFAEYICTMYIVNK